MTRLLSMLYVPSVMLCMNSINATTMSGRIVFPTNVHLLNFQITGNVGEDRHVEQLC